MLALLRVVFGFALFSVFAKAIHAAGPGPFPTTEGTTDAGFVALAVIVGIANAVVWAPLVGRLISDPLTGAFTTGHPADYKNSVIQLVNKLAFRRWRRTALFFAFLEGIRHPDLPAAFILGFNQARPGTWLEAVFAKELWRFDNAENCLRAWRVWHARGVNLGIHRRPEVNLLVLSIQREKLPDPTPLNLATAPPVPPPQRNPKIRLFDGAPSAAPEASATVPSAPVEEALPATQGPPSAAGTESASPPAPEASSESAPTPERPLTLVERLKVLFTGKL